MTLTLVKGTLILRVLSEMSHGDSRKSHKQLLLSTLKEVMIPNLGEGNHFTRGVSKGIDTPQSWYPKESQEITS